MLQCYCQRDFFTIFGSSKTYLTEDFSKKKSRVLFYLKYGNRFGFFFSNYENIYAIYILSKDLRKDM